MSELVLSNGVAIPDQALEWQAMRSQGPGGQNVNKVATAVQLRLDIHRSALPEWVQQRLLSQRDRRLTKDGVLVIKAQSERTQIANRYAALARLQQLLEQAFVRPKTRVPTRPKRSAKRRRLENKRQQSQKKANRQRVSGDE
ncbi:MAG: alternative ribosome rescue aminoacyl-tRNA hydrolase ArfB [Hydrogenovibrio sp.]|uniref:alternative ribosome rescue aminoacyl-tRNA hydrolase ArfB n=1 Tax=Hydrogenovibrio sp. TaxID=2065821 RepID=UPI00286FD732|nr:alternative ribosome rescue aminoacyl-tRNA hydrolase ArfB [Hydrogenovibrio sp.]MDR9498721.1 alternative ribosome rescue aminoacyl-tRNA hydrolase ArfB [Hydrogenovibrio sp.]